MKIIWCMLSLTLLLSAMFGPLSAPMTVGIATKLPEPSIEYVIAIAQPESHTAQISMRLGVLENQTQLSLTISRGESIRRQYLQIQSVLGDDLVNSSVTQLDNFTWQLNLTHFHDVLVRYSVNYTMNQGIYAYIGRDYAVIDEDSLLLNPSPSNRLGFYSVKLQQPAIWTFVSLGNSEYSRVFESPMTELWTHILAFGYFHVSQISRDATMVKLALLSNLTAALPSYRRLVSDLYDQFEQTVGKLHKPILIVIAPRALTIVGFERGTSLYVDNTAGPDALSHELFHLWNGAAMYPVGNEETWFREGVTEYYSKVSLLRLGVSSQEEYLDLFLNSFSWYKSIIGTAHDVPLASAWTTYLNTGDWGFRSVIYEKGKLVAYLINETISEKTKGQKNLDDLMRYMYAAFVYPQNKSRPWFTLDDIRDSLTHVTNSSWQDFFDEYILGSTTLSLPKIAARADYVSSLDQAIADLKFKITNLSASSVFKPLIVNLLNSAQYETTQAENDFFAYRYQEAQEHIFKANSLFEDAQSTERCVEGGVLVLLLSIAVVAAILYVLWRRRKQARSRGS